jgi:hypothetical protein
MREYIPNYFTASGLWRQVIEYSHLILYYKMMDVASPNTRFIGLNSDAFVAVNPTLESVEEAIEINKIKKTVKGIGRLKLEDKIKVKGKRCSEVNNHITPYTAKKKRVKVIKRKDCSEEEWKQKLDKLKGKSILICGESAGVGKSYLLCQMYQEGDLILVPTWGARRAVLKSFEKMGKDIDKKKVKIIAQFFRDDGIISKENQLKGLKNYNRVFIDEIYQVSQGYLEDFHYAQIKYNVKLVCAGAGDQIPAPSTDNIYNFMTNDYFNNYMFDVRLELDYRKDFSRSKDGLVHESLVYVCSTGKIPERFKDRTADKNHWFHLTYTTAERDIHAARCSKRYCKELPDDQKLIDKTFHYGVGMPLVCLNNFKPTAGLKLTNKQQFTITEIDINERTITVSSKTLDKDLTLNLHVIQQNFIPFYAATIDSMQGDSIDKPFSIWEMDNRNFTRNRLNSAIGRAMNSDHIHFHNCDTDKVYAWHEYRSKVYVNVIPENPDKKYENTIIYRIEVIDNKDNIFYYVGHTTLATAQLRLQRHLRDSRHHITDKFHNMLANVDHSKVKVVKEMKKSFRNKAEAEDFEMNCIEKALVKYPGQMLNIRTKRQEHKPIVQSEQKTMTKEEYLNIAQDKKIKVNITILKNTERIQLRYTIDGKRKIKEIRYKECGLDKGMEKAEIMQKELEEQLNGK